MSETESLKVYELAKELGIDSISLLDKLKGLNINVKNHMSELGTADVHAARTALRKPAEGEKTAKKASSSRTAAAKSTATKAAAPAATTAAATPKKATATRKKAAPAAETPAPASAAESAEGKAASSPIIRRRVKSDGATETVSHPPGMRATTPAHVSYEEQHDVEAEESAPTETYEEVPQEESYAGASVRQEASTGAPVYESNAASFSQGESAVSESAAVASAAPSQSHAAGAATSTVTPSALHSAAPAPTPSSVSPTTVSSGAPARPAVPISGATAGAGATSGIAPFTRPTAPLRRSILKIVEPTAPTPPKIIKPAPATTPQAKTQVRGTTTQQDKDGYRIIKMTKENLDQMVEEEAAKKRGGGGRENEIRPEDVRFADYRKKEMVFLPKRKKIPVGKEIRKTQLTQMSAAKRVVEMKETITVADFADQMGVKGTEVVRKLMQMGQMVSLNHAIDFDTATLVAGEYKYEVKSRAFKEAELIVRAEDKAEDLVQRPPIVTIMGHVDHGKTTLLDSIREANVAAGEAGGITQHIGAYTIEKNGKLITFIDTPGHEAFTVMRARGANVTDIVILVVSADDGVMPQTREALSHAQAAKVPIIVAVNKIDKPGANPEKIKQGLAELNLLAEDWGGETMFIPVSALKRTNIDKLLDAILLQAEVLDLKANPAGHANGTVLEARLEKGRGPVVSVLVKAGTLRVGDAIVSGPYPGRVKAMMDDKARVVKEAPPGFAVEVLGFEGVPNAGEKFDVTADESDARDVAQHRVDQNRANKTVAAGTPGKVSLEALFSKIQAGHLKELNVILKADVFGSTEAIRDSLTKLSTEKVNVKVIHAATGGITESDILLASASNALVIGFNVRPETKARQLAESEHVEVKSYSIIYELLDDVKKSMTGLLDKIKVEKFLGRAEVRQIFSVPKIGTVAGTAVIDGKILRGANVRLLRDSKIIFDGKMSSLRRFKDDVKEVATGFECGIGIENYNDLKTGDIIEAYQIDLITPQLEA